MKSEKTENSENLEVFENSEDSDKHSISSGKSALQNFRDAEIRRRREELRRQSEEAEQQSKKAHEQDRLYAKKVAEDRVELLKIKQGIGLEEDFKEAAPKKEYTFKEKVSNFWYHNKFVVIVTALIVCAAGFFVHDIFFRTQPDLKAIIIANDENFGILYDEFAEVLAVYTPDFNGDGKIYVQAQYLPGVMSPDNRDVNYQQAIEAKLFAEFSSSDSVMIFADNATVEALGITEGVFTPADEIFPGDPNAGTIGYNLSGTDFAEKIGYPEISPDIFVAFRTPRESYNGIEEFQKNYNHAVEVWKNYISHSVINEASDGEKVNYE
ncbi:MAG: hypothetical protein LBM87_04535 [Ruminococcus sp.]|nr:hypothetical protein [Ruminococcus sp.]